MPRQTSLAHGKHPLQCQPLPPLPQSPVNQEEKKRRPRQTPPVFPAGQGTAPSLPSHALFPQRGGKTDPSETRKALFIWTCQCLETSRGSRAFERSLSARRGEDEVRDCVFCHPEALLRSLWPPAAKRAPCSLPRFKLELAPRVSSWLASRRQISLKGHSSCRARRISPSVKAERAKVAAKKGRCLWSLRRELFVSLSPHSGAGQGGLKMARLPLSWFPFRASPQTTSPGFPEAPQLGRAPREPQPASRVPPPPQSFLPFLSP